MRITFSSRCVAERGARERSALGGYSVARDFAINRIRRVRFSGARPFALRWNDGAAAQGGCDASVATLGELKDLGFRIAVDDFGTGYSSLSYLRRFPLDTLKIDRSFVRDLPNESSDCAIVEAIIDLGHKLSLEIVAEGVENQRQLDFLRNRGCDQVQGFLYSRPLPFDSLGDWIDWWEAEAQPAEMRTVRESLRGGPSDSTG